MRLALRSCLLVLALVVSAPALAQPNAGARFIERETSDGAADEVLAIITSNLHMARDDTGQLLPPLSQDQLGGPLLDRELVKEVMDIGVASAVGQVCGLNWSDLNFRPMMERERARADRSPHQLAAIAMIHGLVQSSVTQSGGACSDAGRAAAMAFYHLKWGG